MQNVTLAEARRILRTATLPKPPALEPLFGDPDKPLTWTALYRRHIEVHRDRKEA